MEMVGQIGTVVGWILILAGTLFVIKGVWLALVGKGGNKGGGKDGDAVVEAKEVKEILELLLKLDRDIRLVVVGIALIYLGRTFLEAESLLFGV